MNVMFLGMVTEVNPSQPEKVEISILFILGGIVKEVNPLHPLYLQLIVYQFVSLKTVEK